LSQHGADSEAQRLRREGLLAALIAYLLWGLFPIYFLIVASVAPVEVLAHRIVWAVPFGALIIHLRRQWSDVRLALISARMMFWLGLAAVFISANWLIYIWAVQNEKVLQTSLGYYINPLMFVLVSVVFLGERLRKPQIMSVLLATTGVAYLTITGGEFPIIALSLATLFTLYGVIRKQVAVGAMPGLFVETLLLLPIALGWLIWLMQSEQAAFGTAGWSMSGLLILAGPVTVVPLLLFAIGARQLTLTTIGFMQFIAPTLQFFVGIYFGEELTMPNLICFVFIWTAVAIFSVDAFYMQNKKPAQARPAGA
jgi:chloramphenicol-sensitive protein RarD